MIIDSYCHVAPRKFLRDYVKTQLPSLLGYIDGEVGSGRKHIVDDESRIKIMDRLNVDVEVLSLAYRPVWATVPERSLYKITRVANDSLAEFINSHPDRLVGIATLPTLDGESLDELDRSIRDLGMKGVTIATNIGGKPIDSPEFLPFYEKMTQYDLPILIHPTNWKYYDWINEYLLNQILGWPFDSSLAASRLVFSGVMNRFPTLKILIHHTGSMIPFFAERIKGFYDYAKDLVTADDYPYANTNKMKEPLLHYFKLLYADTMVNGSVSALKCGYDFFGADHLLFATDYPHGPNRGIVWAEDVIRSVRELDVDEGTREKIFSGNAKAFFKLKN